MSGTVGPYQAPTPLMMMQQPGAGYMYMQGGCGSPGRERVFCPAVGYFKDMFGHIEGLEEEDVENVEQAASRLVKLKMKINELQMKRESYWTRQVTNAGVAGPSAILTLGTSLLVQGPAAVHQKNRLEQLCREMKGALKQVGKLREVFGGDGRWGDAESTVTIREKVFKHGISRAELRGDL